MAQPPTIKPTLAAIKAYYEALQAYAAQGVTHETAVRTAFQNLLADLGRKRGWTLIPELSGTAFTAAGDRQGARVQPDATFRDEFYVERGYWEAKDTADILENEIKKKIARSYPLTNTIFEDTRVALLYQDGKRYGQYDLTKPQELADLLTPLLNTDLPRSCSSLKSPGWCSDATTCADQIVQN